MKAFVAKVKIFIFWPKTMDYNYSPWFDFWESEKFGEKDTVGKGIPREAEQHKFELRSSFQ